MPRYRMSFTLTDTESGEAIFGGRRIDIEFSTEELRTLPHVKRGRFVNEAVQKAFLSCVHYVRERYRASYSLDVNAPVVVSKDVHGSFNEVKEE